MRMPAKQAVLKYLKPVDTGSKAPEPLFESSRDLEESFGYFALQKKSDALLLNRLEPDEIMELMKKVGLVGHLASLGFGNLKVKISRDEAQIDHLRVYYDEIAPENLLINMRLSKSRVVPDSTLFGEGSRKPILDMVVIEWLSAQNPRESFAPGRPQLPGQSKPGLGSLNYLMETIYIAGKKLLIDGFVDVPEHFHGAVMYSRKFKFFDPSLEGFLQAILRDLKECSLHDLAWGMLTNSITDSLTGEPQSYEPSEQVFPVSHYLKGYFRSKSYRAGFMQAYKSKKYRLDYDAMIERKSELLRDKKIEEL